MGTYGQRSISIGGRNANAFTNPSTVLPKPGSLTLDWNASGWPVGDGVTPLPDGTVVPAGVKYCRYGLPLAKITATGLYGPVDTTANDGRQIVDGSNQGSIYIKMQTTQQTDAHSDHVADVADNGNVFTARMFLTYPNAPSLAQLRTMFRGRLGFID